MSAAEHQAASTAEAPQAGYKPIDEEAFEVKTGSDMGKAALFVALLAVVLMVILYFSQQQNITGMAEQLDGVQGVKQEMAAVQSQMAALEGEMESLVGDMDALVASLKDLPKEARRVVISSMLTESANKVNFLSTQVETQAQQDKLQQIQKMLEEVQAGM